MDNSFNRFFGFYTSGKSCIFAMKERRYLFFTPSFNNLPNNIHDINVHQQILMDCDVTVKICIEC